MDVSSRRPDSGRKGAGTHSRKRWRLVLLAGLLALLLAMAIQLVGVSRQD